MLNVTRSLNLRLLCYGKIELFFEAVVTLNPQESVEVDFTDRLGNSLHGLSLITL